MPNDDLKRAASAWNISEESLDAVVRRIHDGVPSERLEERADGYVAKMFDLFGRPSLVDASAVLEIGSGVGYVMEAIERRARSSGNTDLRIDGLDIAEHMIAKAKERLESRAARFGFLHYDGLEIPVKDAEYDLVYSVASLQHIPKPYVYNLFFEIRRILNDSGCCVLNFLAYRNLPRQARWTTWRHEIDVQIGRARGPHHHFYAHEELEEVLRATGFSDVEVRDGEQIWVCAGR